MIRMIKLGGSVRTNRGNSLIACKEMDDPYTISLLISLPKVENRQVRSSFLYPLAIAIISE